MTDETFLQLVDRGVEALGPDVLKRLDNVAIVVEDAPTKVQREEMGMAEGEQLFGLYEGVPQSERGLEDIPQLPDKITIFKKPILSAYINPADIARCVENTVWHELAHHFGFDEEWVAKEEVRRGKTH